MKGILFTELLFQKTIKGEKTQTRREGSLKAINDNPDDWQTGANTHFYHPPDTFMDDKLELGFGFCKADSGMIGMVDPELTLKPRYNIGDICYLKEPYQEIITDMGENTMIIYKYDYSYSDQKALHPWKNKLFTPESVARYYIKITSVKCERLLDISDSDCMKEGIDLPIYTQEVVFDNGKKAKFPGYKDYADINHFFLHPQESFFSLFRFANKIPKSKEIGNPWLFVYSYYLCDKEGNKI